MNFNNEKSKKLFKLLKGEAGEDALRPIVLLAPMAGITDSAFRRLCVFEGCDLTFTEMVSANGIHYKNRKTQELIHITDEEKPCGVQLFGHDPEIIAETIERLFDGIVTKSDVAAIDINMGCPAPKITSNGDGSALMRNMPLAERIIISAVKASPVPVSVKIRRGWDEDSVNAIEFSKMAEQAGASFITLHGRTRMQMYSGKADRELIARAVESVNIPLIGNGDIFSAQSALDMLKETGCAGIMVARGAQGNPFIFSEIRAALEKRAYTPPNEAKRLEAALTHINEYLKNHGSGSFVDMRKHIAWYTKGMYGSTELRRRVNECSGEDELIALVSEFKREHEERI